MTNTFRTVVVSAAFGWIIPYRSDTARSGSAIIGKLGARPWVSSMSIDQRTWASSGSTLRPMTLTPRRSNSGLSRATSPSSVVQTGVKSFGWEKSTPQPSPSHSWKLMVPIVVSAVKSGASSPSWSTVAVGTLMVLVILDLSLHGGAHGELLGRDHRESRFRAG